MGDQSGYTIMGSILVWGLIIGTLLSYVPQYYKIFKKKNTKGISEYTILCGVYSCLLNISGTILENYNSLYYCTNHNNCYNKIIPIIQLLAPYICMVTLYVFYLKYYKLEGVPNISYYYISAKERNKKIAIITIVLNISFIVTTIILVKCLSFRKLSTVGKIFNIASSCVSTIMWIPQIYKTYTVKNDYSLSLVALTIHSIGCFITVVYQVGFANQGLYVVLSYIIGGISEASIVLMILYYRKYYNIKDKNLLIIQNYDNYESTTI